MCLLISVLPTVNVLDAADVIEELGPPHDVAFTARLDETEQRYVVRLPINFDASKTHNVLIALHGHGSDRWQFAKDGRDECRAARDVAAKHRMIFVSPDYRAKTSWMGPAATADLVQIVDDLHGKYRIEKMILCGGSMGGTSALAFAAMHPELVDGIVSLNGTANMVEYAGFAEAISVAYGGTKAEKPDVYRVRSAELFPERFIMPVAFTTGGRDTLVPPDCVLRLAAALKERNSPVHLNHRPAGGHETSYDDSMAAFQYVCEKCLPSANSVKPLLTFDSGPRKIVCLGDSVTGVYYHTGGRRAYPEMLELGLRTLFPKSNITVINAGISGHTTKEGLARLERDVLSHEPDLVTVSFGLNDMTRLTPQEYRTNLESLISQCRERGCQGVLCTPNAVIDTQGRPIGKLVEYCDIIHEVGRQMSVPVCDQYQAGADLHSRAPWTWRLTLSDEIHPNMDGHKRMAEELCRTIAGQSLSLDSVGPAKPSLQKCRAQIERRQPIKVLAMSPFDRQIGDALKQLNANATVQVTTWSIEGKSIPTLEQDAKALVRSLKPDLVVIAVPATATAETDEQFVRSFSWIMNWSLSFGQQEWDCVVVHPSVAQPAVATPRQDLYRRLVWAQNLELIDRPVDDTKPAANLFADWFAKRVNE